MGLCASAAGSAEVEGKCADNIKKTMAHEQRDKGGFHKSLAVGQRTEHVEKATEGHRIQP